MLDLALPALDGLGFLELCRDLPGPHAPVIVMSAASARALDRAARHAAAVITKPFEVDHLLELVAHHAARGSVAVAVAVAPAVRERAG